MVKNVFFIFVRRFYLKSVVCPNVVIIITHIDDDIMSKKEF